MLESIEEWFYTHKSIFMQMNITSNLHGPSQGHDKNSIAAEFQGGKYDGSVQYWDSGECDIAIVDMEIGEYILNATQIFPEPTKLLAVLKSIFELISNQESEKTPAEFEYAWSQSK